VRVCVLLLATNLALANPLADMLWTDLQLAIDIGDNDAALDALAELIGFPEERGPALEKAAYMLLKQGEEQQAISLLRDLIQEPEYTFHATTLIGLLFKDAAYQEVVEVVQSLPQLSWDDQSQQVILLSFRKAGLKPPKLSSLRPQAPIKYEIRYVLLNTQHDTGSGFDTDSSQKLKLRLETPVADDWHLGGWVEDGSSQADNEPLLFREHYADFTEVGVYLRKRTKSWRAYAAIGTHQLDLDGGPNSDFGDQFGWDLRFRYKLNDWEVRLISERDSLLTAHFFGETLELRDRNLVSLGRRLGDFELRASLADIEYDQEIQGGLLPFSSEDYRLASFKMEYYPPAAPGAWLDITVDHEFREEKETLVRAGPWYIKQFGKRSSLFAGFGFEHNLTNDEQTIDVQLYRTFDLGSHTLQAGLYANQGIAGRRDKTGMIIIGFKN